MGKVTTADIEEVSQEWNFTCYCAAVYRLIAYIHDYDTQCTGYDLGEMEYDAAETLVALFGQLMKFIGGIDPYGVRRGPVEVDDEEDEYDSDHKIVFSNPKAEQASLKIKATAKAIINEFDPPTYSFVYNGTQLVCYGELECKEFAYDDEPYFSGRWKDHPRYKEFLKFLKGEDADGAEVKTNSVPEMEEFESFIKPGEFFFSGTFPAGAEPEVHKGYEYAIHPLTEIVHIRAFDDVEQFTAVSEEHVKALREAALVLLECQVGQRDRIDSRLDARSAARIARSNTVEPHVLALLKRSGKWMTTTRILSALDKAADCPRNEGHIKTILARMVRQGKLQNFQPPKGSPKGTPRGYGLAEWPTPDQTTPDHS